MSEQSFANWKRGAAHAAWGVGGGRGEEENKWMHEKMKTSKR